MIYSNIFCGMINRFSEVFWESSKGFLMMILSDLLIRSVINILIVVLTKAQFFLAFKRWVLQALILRRYSITLSRLVMLIIANTTGISISYIFIITLSYATTVLTGASLGARKIIRTIMINWIYSITIASLISLSIFFMLRIFWTHHFIADSWNQ